MSHLYVGTPSNMLSQVIRAVNSTISIAVEFAEEILHLFLLFSFILGLKKCLPLPTHHLTWYLCFNSTSVHQLQRTPYLQFQKDRTTFIFCLLLRIAICTSFLYVILLIHLIACLLLSLKCLGYLILQPRQFINMICTFFWERVQGGTAVKCTSLHHTPLVIFG